MELQPRPEPSREAYGPLDLTVRISHSPGEAVVELTGELDIATVGRVKAALEEVEQAAPHRLVIDLSGLSFVDSSGLAVFMALHKRCRENGGPALEIRPGPPAVQRLFELVGAAGRLPFRDGSVVDDASLAQGRASGRGSAVP